MLWTHVDELSGDSMSDGVFAGHNNASSIIVTVLNDAAFRVVRSVIGNPVQMLKKLDAWYDSKTTSSNIRRMVKLLSLKYRSVRFDISKHIDKMAAFLE